MEKQNIMYEFKLPNPPSINNYYGTHCKFNHATIYVKSKGKEYQKTVLEYIISNNLQLRANIPLSVDITFTPRSNHRQDVDNVLKCALDALTNASVYDDDSLIYSLSIIKTPPSKENAGLYIKISPFEIEQ